MLIGEGVSTLPSFQHKTTFYNPEGKSSVKTLCEKYPLQNLENMVNVNNWQ